MKIAIKIGLLIAGATAISLGFQNCSPSKTSVAADASTNAVSQPGTGNNDGGTGSGGTTKSCLGSPTATAPNAKFGLTPQQLRSFTGVDQLSGCGEGQTIAVIISAQATDITGDLGKFSAAFGLPAPTADNFKIIKPDGACSLVGTPIESHIDVEMVHAFAPMATLLMVCPGDATIAGKARAINAAIANGATVVSMSWGEPENSTDMSALEPIFSAHPEVTFVAGSGDSGSNDLNGVPRTAYPASSKYVIAVGAVADTGSSSLAVWPMSGGGISNLTPRPAYQSSVATFGSGRLLPDLSMNGAAAAPSAIYGAMGWTGAVGTSVAAPLFGAVVALANQVKGSAVGDIHTKIYSLNTTNLYSTYFRDAVTGTNGDYGTKVGYDLTSGLGVPRADLLVPFLAAP